jgi:hypothetical protein
MRNEIVTICTTIGSGKRGIFQQKSTHLYRTPATILTGCRYDGFRFRAQRILGPEGAQVRQ